jgi:HAMP domain-containing protein/HPt (histidine-containing phosphotransfer) domain-containing protein
LSLGTKLAALTVAVLALTTALLYVELTGRERKALLLAKGTAASMVTDLFAASLDAPLDFGDLDAVNAALDNVKTNADVTCATVWDKTDKPLAELRRGECGDRPAPADAELVGRTPYVDRVEVARAVVGRAGGRVGKTRLVFSLARENEAFAASRARTFWLSAALAMGTALLLIALSRPLIVSPLKRLSDAARRIGRGDFTARVEATSGDEIGHLAGALNRMREAIADREQRLEAATQNVRDLFDNMGQAIVAFGRDGRVHGPVSRQAGKVFALLDLEGVAVRDLLYGASAAHDADVQAFDEWLAMAFDVGLDEWQDFAALAPREVTLRANAARPIPLELEFRPVAKGGAVDQVMLLATDVSVKRKLEQTVQTQEEEHARRMTAMRRLVAGGGQVFVGFVDTSRDKIARCLELTGLAPRTLAMGEIDEIFRHVHTIKGEARAFDLLELESECAKLEEELDEVRTRARSEGLATTGSVHGAMQSRLFRAKAALERGCDVFVAASPIGKAALDQVTVQKSDIQELEKLAAGHGDALAHVVERLASRPFGESTASLIDMTPTWAEKEGKRVVLDVEGREVHVPPALARVLGGVMTHLVRNSIAHGIEPPAVRVQHGKPALGTVRARATPGAGGPTIDVEDDGRGLDLEGLAARAAELGVRAPGKEKGSLAQLVFVAGLSTLESAGALAGRGVGLDAVRVDIERAGYGVEVASEPGRFTRFTIAPRA